MYYYNKEFAIAWGNADFRLVFYRIKKMYMKQVFLIDLFWASQSPSASQTIDA